MKRTIALVACLSLASGCTSSLKPIGLDPSLGQLSKPNAIGPCAMPANVSLQDLMAPERVEVLTVAQAHQDQNDESKGKPISYANSRLDWLSCEMLAHSMKNFDQSEWLKNRTEWRDLPLIGSALAIGALVLFGKRGMDGNLSPGETDVIEGVALGTAGYSLLARYANPEQASQLLYQSARGHRCLAEHGQVIATYGRDLTGVDGIELERSLRNSLAALRQAINAEGAPASSAAASRITEARTALSRGEQALAFRVQQKRAREIAPARLYLAAYDFGMAMTRKARREPVDIADIQSTLRKTIELQREGAGLVPEGQADPAAVEALTKHDGARLTTTTATRLTVAGTNLILRSTPSIAPLVAQLELCTDLAVLGGTSLPEPEIRYGPEPN